MLSKKQKHKKWRKAFNEAVFGRDGGRCVMCSDCAVDAHHILPRKEMPNGGYVPENGISLCGPCHEKAEAYYSSGKLVPGFSPEDLFKKIGSDERFATLRSEWLDKKPVST